MKKIFDLINKNILFFTFGDRQKKQQKKELPLITISRETGSGGKIIAYLVAKKLGGRWKVYHKEIINQIARHSKIEKELIEEVDEKHIPLIDQVIADFFGKKYLSLSTYYKELIKILSTIGNRGWAIIIGRGADYLFPHALKVRIICEMKQRILWMKQYEHLTEKEAIARIEKSDRERQKFIKTLFHHDIKKAHHYDLVIRTGPNLSINDAADLIVRLTKRRFKL